MGRSMAGDKPTFVSTHWPLGLRARFTVPSGDRLEITLEDGDVVDHALGPARPQVFAAELHVVGGFIYRVEAMGMRVGEGRERSLGHDDADLAADVARHADMARDEIV